MKLLLDIDGVMVTTPSWGKVELLDDQFSKFNSKASFNLNKIIAETNVSVILTTSHKSSYNVSEWKTIFEKRGIHIDFLSCLENNVNHLSRKDEILNWINSGEEKDDFVIIDDDKSLNDLPQNIKKRCVITNQMIGLNDEAALAAIRILRNQQEAAYA